MQLLSVMRLSILALAISAPLSAHLARAEEVRPDDVGRSLSLPRAFDDHWVWLNEPLMKHSKLFDGDSGEVLGIVDTSGSLTGRHPLISRERGETYVMETFYSRGNRGVRKDVITIYDSKSLKVIGEIEIPPRTADVGHGLALGAVLDGSRFLVVFNQEPANSVSVIDLQSRSYRGEISTAGCALVYPVSARSFGMLCGDGSVLRVELDDDGNQRRVSGSEPFFDVVADPLTEKGVRDGGRWHFASFEGYLHEVDFSAAKPRLVARWSLFGDEQRTRGWRIGGIQHLALHRLSGRLFSVVHQGGKGTHKDAGTSIWVYDLAKRQRLQTIETPTLLANFLCRMAQVEPDSWTAWAMHQAIPSRGVHSVVVTPDSEPLLFVRHRETGAAGVFDALTGKFMHFLEETGLGGALMVVP